MSVSSQLLPGVPLVESPLFSLSIDDMGLTNYERDVAIQLNERGYAVIDFPDDQILARIDRIKENLKPRYGINFDMPGAIKNKGDHRIQDAWTFDADVKAIACNQNLLDLLSKLYGRRAFAFQTLNFPVGTQQTAHTDSVHFSSVPERFMCGVWVAMEDIGPDAGPLVYYPGSHKWPILYNELLDRRADVDRISSAQAPYEAVWIKMAEAQGIQPETFLAKKGQALIWAANLLHGGSRQNDLTLTRWSQVTHYYFENCTYFTPAFSEPFTGNLDVRTISDISNGKVMDNIYVDARFEDLTAPAPVPAGRASRVQSAMGMISGMMGGKKEEPEGLPADFDPDRYYQLNPDVAAAKADAVHHWMNHGRHERRRYR